MELANQEHQFIAEIKERVRKAQYEALKVVNTELITLYWDIGRAIVDKQKLGWGTWLSFTLNINRIQISNQWLEKLVGANTWLFFQR